MTDAMYRELVHSPAELAQEHVLWASLLKDAPGVSFGIDEIDEIVTPFHPGDMVTFTGRPGHGKTSILAILAREEGKRIVERGTQEIEAVVYVTWEQVTEEINAVMMCSGPGVEYTVNDVVRGNVDLDTIRRHAIKRVHDPVWIVGESLARTNINSPRMFPEVVFKAIESMKQDFGRKPTLMLFDYIQLIPIRGQSKRHEQVMEASHRCKELAKRAGCPAAVAVQAKRDVDLRDWKMPTQFDAQWSSAIEATGDKFFGLWRPWLTEPHTDKRGNPTVLTLNGVEYESAPTLLLMGMFKQRFAEPRHTWALHFDPRYLRLCELETDVEEALQYA